MKKNKMPFQIRVSNSLVGILLKKSAPVHIVPTCTELRKSPITLGLSCIPVRDYFQNLIMFSNAKT
jgi:hypothetical protein